MACIVVADSLQRLVNLCYEDITIWLIGIQNCGRSHAIKAKKGCFGGTNAFKTLAVIYRNLNYKAWILLRGATNGKPTAAFEPIKISKVVFDFPHPPPAFNCFLSNVVGKQCAASRQTSTALQVCRQLGKPLCLELYPAAVEPSEGQRSSGAF